MTLQLAWKLVWNEFLKRNGRAEVPLDDAERAALAARKPGTAGGEIKPAKDALAKVWEAGLHCLSRLFPGVCRALMEDAISNALLAGFKRAQNAPDTDAGSPVLGLAWFFQKIKWALLNELRAGKPRVALPPHEPDPGEADRMARAEGLQECIRRVIERYRNGSRLQAQTVSLFDGKFRSSSVEEFRELAIRLGIQYESAKRRANRFARLVERRCAAWGATVRKVAEAAKTPKLVGA